jgi:hypothetical protein
METTNPRLIWVQTKLTYKNIRMSCLIFPANFQRSTLYQLTLPKYEVFRICMTGWYRWMVANLKLRTRKHNKRLPGACNRSPESKLLSITTQLHCGGHLGGRARLPDTILEKDHPMTIPSKFGSNWATGSRQDGFYANFP